MFTVKDVINKVRTKLAEENPQNSFFSDAFIISCINDNLLTVARDLEITNRRISITTIPNQREYVLPDEVIEVNDVWIEKDNYRYEVKYVEWDDFLTQFDDNQTGDLLYVYYLRNELLNNDYRFIIGFYPLPSKSMQVFLDVLVEHPVVNNENDVIYLPKSCKDLLVMLVLAEMYERDKRYNEANYFLAKYRDRLVIEQVKQKSKIVEYVE